MMKRFLAATDGTSDGEHGPQGGTTVRLVDPVNLLAAIDLGAGSALSTLAADTRARLLRVARALQGPP